MRRLLFVVHGFPPDTWAGTEVYTLGLAQAFQRRGHEVHVLTRAPQSFPGETDGSLRTSTFEGLKVHRLTRRTDGLAVEESYSSAWVERFFGRFLEQLRPDIVHYQHLLHLSCNLPLVSRAAGIPSVLTINDYWALCARVQLIRPDGVRCESNQGVGCYACIKDQAPAWQPRLRALRPLLSAGARLLRPLARVPQPSAKLARPLSKLEKRCGDWLALEARHEVVLDGYAAADLLIAPSEFLRQKLIASGRIDPARILHSDYGMRTEGLRVLDKQPDPGGRLRVGFVGSLVWYKGVDVLIRALDGIAPEKLVLNIFGAFEPAKDAHHRELETLARGKPVQFRGRFDNQRIAEVYSEIDVLVVPSTWFENSPLTIHEAWLQRTPVIASDIGGMRELVTHERDGLHFVAGDAAALRSALLRLADDRALLARFGANVPKVKSLEEDAAQMQLRYEVLLSQTRR